MKNTSRSIAIKVGCVILISGTWASAQDWPQWRGPNRDGKAAGFTAPQKWPTALTQKWKETVGLGDATPALVGEKLYVFTRQDANEVLQCLNAGDGKQLWKDAYEAQAVSGAAGRHPGPRSSPAVAEGKVVTLGVGGVLSCLDAATGKVVWRKDEFPKIVPKFFTAMSPIIVDGMAVAHLGGPDNGAVMAFDLATGDLKWKWSGDSPAYGSPILTMMQGTKQILAQTEKNLVSIAVADGKLLWQIPTQAQGRFYNSATPIVDGQTLIYTGQGQGTKAVKIDRQGDGFTITPLWTNADLGTGFNTPVLKDGLLFGLSDKGLFFCINAQTGKTAWTDTTKRETFGSLVDVGSAILASTEKSGLIAFKPTDGSYQELAQIKVSDAPIYSHPVVAGKRIFTKDAETLTLWTTE